MAKHRIQNLVIIWAALLFFSISCEQPSSTFERTSGNDPLSYNFVPEGEKGIDYSFQNGTLILAWEDFSDLEDGYIIEKAINDTVKFKQVETLPANTREFDDNDIEYFYITYRISPLFEKNGKQYRGNYKELILNRHKPESIYYELITEKSTEIFITDDANPSFIDGYEVERKESENPYKLVLTIEDLSSLPKINVIDSTLIKEGNYYQYRFRAYNKDGKSFYTESFCCYDFRISPPSLTQIQSIDDSKINIHWDYDDNKAEGVIIERSEFNSNSFSEIASLDASKTSYSDQNLDQNNTYYYRIKSLGSEYSETAKVVYQNGLFENKRLTSAEPLQNVRFRPGTNEFLSAYRNGSQYIINLWNDDEESPYYEFTFTDRVADIEFNSDGSYMGLAFHNGYIRTFNPENISNYSYSRVKENSIGTSISFKPNSDIAAVGYADGVILIMEFASFNGEQAVVKHTLNDLDSVSDLSYSNNGSYLIATGENGIIIKYDATNNYQMVNSRDGHDDLITKAAISHNNQLIATSSRDESIKIWNSEDLSLVNSFTYQDFYYANIPVSLAFSNDDKLLFSGTSHRLILVWNLNEGKLSQTLKTRYDDISETVSDMDVNETNNLLSSSYLNLIYWEIDNGWIKKEN